MRGGAVCNETGARRAGWGVGGGAGRGSGPRIHNASDPADALPIKQSELSGCGAELEKASSCPVLLAPAEILIPLAQLTTTSKLTSKNHPKIPEATNKISRRKTNPKATKGTQRVHHQEAEANRRGG